MLSDPATTKDDETGSSATATVQLTTTTKTKGLAINKHANVAVCNPTTKTSAARSATSATSADRWCLLAALA